MSLIRKFLSLFAWRDVADEGVWTLRENVITGERAVIRSVEGGHSPYPARWISEGISDPIIHDVPYGNTSASKD